MPPIDWALLINWLVTGFIGLFFGVIGGYLTYRLERKRDDIRWAREKEQLELSWKHDKEQMELIWQQKLQELEIHFLRDEQNRLRQDILKGIDNPRATIEQYIHNRESVLRQTNVEIIKSLIATGSISRSMIEQIEVLGKEITEILLESSGKQKAIEMLSPNPQLSSNNDEGNKESE